MSGGASTRMRKACLPHQHHPPSLPADLRRRLRTNTLTPYCPAGRQQQHPGTVHVQPGWLALQKSGSVGLGRAALHQLMGPQVKASRRWACSWYCRDTNTAFLLGSLRVTYLQASSQVGDFCWTQPEGQPLLLLVCGTSVQRAGIAADSARNFHSAFLPFLQARKQCPTASPGSTGQRDALALTHSVEPKAAVVAHHLVRLLLHNRARPLPKVLPADARPGVHNLQRGAWPVRG